MDVESVTVAAVVLAAGEGSRFGSADSGHKLLADFRGRPLASWALSAALIAGFDRVYVVTGAVDVSAAVDDALTVASGQRASAADTLTVLANPAWADGQATSLAVAVDAATAEGHGALVVGLADQPGVPASAWRAVGAAAGRMVTATFDGKRRPPVKLDRSVWSDLPTTGDEGARVLFRQWPELVLELPCSGSAFDIDTLEDLERWS